jgi:hypothetical protein
MDNLGAVGNGYDGKEPTSGRAPETGTGLLHLPVTTRLLVGFCLGASKRWQG